MRMRVFMDGGQGLNGPGNIGGMITRRGFVASGFAAVAAGLPPGVVAEAGTASAGEIRLGVASYSFHKFERQHVLGFLKELACTRINSKDVLDHLPMTPMEATDAAVAAYRAAGITLTGGGVIYFPKADEADVRAKFVYARRAGLPLIVGAPTHASLPVVEKLVKEFDLPVAIHNHGPEDSEWPSPIDILAVLEPKGGPTMDARMGLCVDVGHCARTGIDVAAAIRRAGPRVLGVHIKDLADMRVKESQVAVGDGKMPVAEIFRALVAIEYKGTVDLEYEIHDDDPLPGMVKSFAYMRGVLAGLGYRAG